MWHLLHDLGAAVLSALAAYFAWRSHQQSIQINIKLQNGNKYAVTTDDEQKPVKP